MCRRDRKYTLAKTIRSFTSTSINLLKTPIMTIASFHKTLKEDVERQIRVSLRLELNICSGHFPHLNSHPQNWRGGVTITLSHRGDHQTRSRKWCSLSPSKSLYAVGVGHKPLRYVSSKEHLGDSNFSGILLRRRKKIRGAFQKKFMKKIESFLRRRELFPRVGFRGTKFCRRLKP